MIIGSINGNFHLKLKIIVKSFNKYLLGSIINDNNVELGTWISTIIE